jgi:integrase
MPRLPSPARVVFWHGAYHFFFTDEQGKHRRIKCEAAACYNEAQRNKRVRELRNKERHDAARRLQLGTRIDYDHNFIHAIGLYITHMDERRDVEESTKREARKALDPFAAWLKGKHARLTTGSLDGRLLSSYFNSLNVAPATVNKVRRNVKAMVRWLHTLRPMMFPSIEHLMPSLRQEEVERRDTVAFSPAELRQMREELDHDQQCLFTFLAVTGCRLAEALALTWDDVNLERGRIHFKITKTGRSRILPLIDAPEGDVGPGLLKEMRRWHKQGALRPCGAVNHRREHWRSRGVCNPHMLRANWVSYAASMNVPASVAALWAGHSAAIAEHHYRMQVLDRIDASDLQGAMGL